MATYFFWKAIRETHWDFGWIAGTILSCGLVGLLMICFVAMLVLGWRRNRPFPDGPVETAACVGGVMWFFFAPIAIDLLPLYGLYRLFRHLAESRGKGMKDKLYEANLRIAELEREHNAFDVQSHTTRDEIGKLKTENAKLQDLLDGKTGGIPVDGDGISKEPRKIARLFNSEAEGREIGNRMLRAIEMTKFIGRGKVDMDMNRRVAIASIWFNPMKAKPDELLRTLTERIDGKDGNA